jgi:hypothetical protein
MDYIPNPDNEFDNFATNFYNVIAADPTGYGLTPAQVTTLGDTKSDWSASYGAFQLAESTLSIQTTAKDEQRAPFESLIRSTAQAIQNNTTVTDDMRTAVRLPIYKTTSTPSPVPSTAPMLQKVDSSTRAILRLFFADSATPTKRQKPTGVMYCEIREQIGGTAPVNPETMTFLAAETRSPYRADFDAMDVGKPVWFVLRWVNTRGESGPWSEIFSEIVPG